MNAKTEVDFLHNFKILQTAFGKKKIDRFIEVDKLTKRSFQYNMEFLQFIKCYWDMARSQPPTPCNALRGLRFPPRSQHAPDGVAPDAVFHESAGNEQAHLKQQPPARKAPPAGAKTAPGIGSAKREIADLRLSVDNLERERDFYYTKLREVEILCQQHEGEQVPFLQQILEILYKTDDADEFVNPELISQEE
ncbi:MAG: hypothetical protein SGPRY_009388, partial [Prymnesium sp.]